MSDFVADDMAASIVKEIARKALQGDYDILLACRDIYDLRHRLPVVSDRVLDPIVGVASEVEDLPLGNERAHWAADALVPIDREAAIYRNTVTRYE